MKNLFEELCKENELRDIVTDEKSLAESSSQLPGSVAGNLEMLLRIGKPKLRDKIKVAKIAYVCAARRLLHAVTKHVTRVAAVTIFAFLSLWQRGKCQ